MLKLNWCLSPPLLNWHCCYTERMTNSLCLRESLLNSLSRECSPKNMHTNTAVCWGAAWWAESTGQFHQAPGSITACQVPLGFVPLAGPCRDIWLLRRTPSTDTHVIYLHFGGIHLKICFLVLLCVPKECGGPVSETPGSEPGLAGSSSGCALNSLCNLPRLQRESKRHSQGETSVSCSGHSSCCTVS